MKHPLYLLLLIFVLASCAATDMQRINQKEVALATQQVGEEHYRNGRYTAALKNLLDAQKELSDDPFLHNSLGLVYLAKERADLAQTHFERALELKPDYIQAQNNLGGAYMKLEKWDLAISTYKIVVSSMLYATPEIPLSNLGWAYLNQSMFKQAENYFNQSLDIRPHFINAVHGLATIHIKQGNYSNALVFIHDALKKNPGVAILHADIAETYEALRDDQKAKNAWNVVLKLVPERSPLAKEAQKRLLNLN
ncbi:MAG: tetratricopeptide repeat protein [Pseudomonadota bacterium]